MTPVDFDPFGGRVMLSCKATVAGEEIQVSMYVAAPVYEDPEARKLVMKQLRFGLMEKILEKWTPVIRVVR